jgi:hypothetical protein
LDRPLSPIAPGDPYALGHAKDGEAVDAAHGDGGLTFWRSKVRERRLVPISVL